MQLIQWLGVTLECNTWNTRSWITIAGDALIFAKILTRQEQNTYLTARDNSVSLSNICRPQPVGGASIPRGPRRPPPPITVANEVHHLR